MGVNMNVIIVGGFLNSGKTTTLIRIGRYLTDKGYKVAIILNELGDVGIDDSTFKGLGLNVSEMTSGCICCTLNINMKATLVDLQSSYDPDFVLVEPSGLAFPDRIKENIELMDLGDSVKVAPVITLIACDLFKDLMKSLKNYAIGQIEGSDILVINKSDLVSSARASLIVDSVLQLNSRAKVFPMSSEKEDSGFLKLMELTVPSVAIEGQKPETLPSSAPVTCKKTTIVLDYSGDISG